jgi:3-oxoacyl-[acyl-carrier-protein] synthase II
VVRSIVIESYAAAGGIDALWRGWVAGGAASATAAFPTVAALTAAWLPELRRLGPGGTAAARTGLVLATTKGDVDAEVAWLRATDGGATAGGPPPLSALADAFAATAGVAGPAWAVSTACSSGLVALIDAAFALCDGDADRMIVCGFDVAGDFVRDGFRALKALSPAGACRPFDAGRDGLTLGSAAAGCVLALAPPGSAARAVVSGWGVAGDAVHMTAPDRAAGGLVRAMRQALAMAGLRAGDVDVLFAHGTGTRYNDAMEATAVDAVFREGGARGPAITAVKGLIGHTLGACGVVESLLAVRMLEEGVVPPVVGLLHPERADLDLVTAPRHMAVRHVMKVASGFGGLNAAVIFSKPAVPT